MKERIHYLIEGALAIAIIILFVLLFTGTKKEVNGFVSEAPKSGDGQETKMPFALVDVDSLLLNYTFCIDLNEQMVKKIENSSATLTAKGRQLQADINEFQKKVELNSFLSQQSYDSQLQQLNKKQEDYQLLEQKMRQELEEEQYRINVEVRSMVLNYMNDYNKSKGFHIIFGKRGDNILYADDVYDVTGEVIDFFNRQHALAPEGKKE